MMRRDDDARSGRWRRSAIGGVICAAAIGLVGLAVEGWRFGREPAVALDRVEAEVGARVIAMAGSLEAAVARLAADPTLASHISERDGARALFERVAVAARPAPQDLSLTVYGPAGAALAWRGRPSELPLARIAGPAALFVTPGPPGLRLVYVEPVFDGRAGGEPDADAAPPRRVGAIAAERVLVPALGGRTLLADEYLLPTSIAPVALRTRYEGAGDPPGQPGSFLLYAPEGEPLLEGRIDPAAVDHARARARRELLGIVLAVLAVPVLVLVGPILDRRFQDRTPSAWLRHTAAAAGVLVVARTLLWVAVPDRWVEPPLFVTTGGVDRMLAPLLRSRLDLLLTALMVVGLVALTAGGIGRLGLALRSSRTRAPVGRAGRVAIHLLAGALLALLVGAFLPFAGLVVEAVSVDLLHLALHPWDPDRLALLAGLVLVQAGILWTATLLLIAAREVADPRRSDVAARALMLGAWGLPSLLLLGFIRVAGGAPAAAGVLLGVAICIAAAAAARRAAVWYRHASHAARLLSLVGAFIVPALVLYPSLLSAADRAKRGLIETQYAVQAASHPQELQERLSQALDEIDEIPGLVELVGSLETASGTGPPPTDAAFLIWSQTALAQFRLTSAIELYGPDGSLVSRFALNFPEYTSPAQRWQGAVCEWDVFGEAAPFGSQERRVLHAERALCLDEAGTTGADPPSLAGAIVVHVMPDYRTLPFISSRSPYFELFRTGETPDELLRGRDVELVIYGWGLHPVFVSGAAAWPIDQALFSRIYASREPFWTRLARGGAEYHVHVANDRAGIYAIGYPALGVFDHLVHLAELSTLAGLIYVGVLAGAGLFRAAARARPRFGRALLREIRASFYRKLFLAFVAAAVVPVLTLSLVIRGYFVALLRADIEAEAARTAAVAQRVIEETAVLQQRPEEPLVTLNDDVMVWISQVIDQDVNVFEGPRLVATSQRDLFASGLLPTRTPDDVYREIVLERMPRYVGEDAIGSFGYMVAAAPVRTGGRDAILTVPLTLRQQEIEREVEELDRGVLLAALVFILLGAGIGFSMAERIADPVRRLTRATRRIAGGDFDARIAASSSDELRDLVEAFNSMAAELKAQRAQLERTHRLEAWADMARQVAHEIKNPLTPIQLSAEHLRRVHLDCGQPLGSVLESCIDSILGQVRLLRQIAAEFSSFASSPAARPASTGLPELLEEVLEPYRTGLGGRIAIETAIAPALPPLFVDRTLVARALTNVVENALHAMPGTGRLVVSAALDGDRVHLAVADDGAGMDAEALARIFEPYFSTRASGTGLGLTIAKRNVELSHGTITVESEKGRGTVVTMTLPVHRRVGDPDLRVD